MKKITKIAKPYIAQYKRSPLWVRIVTWMIIAYLVFPIHIWDVLFPWMAFAEDLFLAGVLLKLLHKYGALPEEDRTTPKDILNQIKLTKDSE